MNKGQLTAELWQPAGGRIFFQRLFGFDQNQQVLVNLPPVLVLGYDLLAGYKRRAAVRD
jgi:hypothetical protein